MRHKESITGLHLALIVALFFGAGTTIVMATAPCDDFGECKALIEINSSDGDIGFHFLMDGDDLNSAQINDPNGAKIFEDQAKGPLKEQKLTETFTESAEPLCWPDPEADLDDEIVTLEEFLDRWTPGTYTYSGMSDGGEKSTGETVLTFAMPAAPQDVAFDGSVITWDAGDDLGNCASAAELDVLVAEGVIPVHPELVEVAEWEVVFDTELPGSLKFNVRVPGDIAVKAVTVPADFLASLPDDTAAKIEIGAIGIDDNATFTEEGDICVNEAAGCE